MILGMPFVAYEKGIPTISSPPTPSQGIESLLLEAPKSPPIPPVLHRIAECESGGKHFDEHNRVVRGVNPNDIGKYQINVVVWGEEAAGQGIDIYTEEGNEAMALMLYSRYDTRPWRSSQTCWDHE